MQYRMYCMSLANWINESIVCFAGMGKEVENLISENTELLATKYVHLIHWLIRMVNDIRYLFMRFFFFFIIRIGML